MGSKRHDADIVLVLYSPISASWRRIAPAIPGVPTVSRVLDPQPAAHEARAVQVLDSVLGVLPLIELGEAIAALVLDDDVPHASIALEQLLNVAIPDIFGEVTNVNLGHAHCALYLGDTC